MPHSSSGSGDDVTSSAPPPLPPVRSRVAELEARLAGAGALPRVGSFSGRLRHRDQFFTGPSPGEAAEPSSARHPLQAGRYGRQPSQRGRSATPGVHGGDGSHRATSAPPARSPPPVEVVGDGKGDDDSSADAAGPITPLTPREEGGEVEMEGVAGGALPLAPAPATPEQGGGPAWVGPAPPPPSTAPSAAAAALPLPPPSVEASVWAHVPPEVVPSQSTGSAPPEAPRPRAPVPPPTQPSFFVVALLLLLLALSTILAARGGSVAAARAVSRPAWWPGRGGAANDAGTVTAPLPLPAWPWPVRVGQRGRGHQAAAGLLLPAMADARALPAGVRLERQLPAGSGSQWAAWVGRAAGRAPGSSQAAAGLPLPAPPPPAALEVEVEGSAAAPAPLAFEIVDAVEEGGEDTISFDDAVSATAAAAAEEEEEEEAAAAASVVVVDEEEQAGEEAAAPLTLSLPLRRALTDAFQSMSVLSAAQGPALAALAVGLAAAAVGFAGAVAAPALDQAARRRARRAERARARPAGSGTHDRGQPHHQSHRPALSGRLDAPLLGGSRLSSGWYHGDALHHHSHPAAAAQAAAAQAAAHRAEESRYNSDDSAASSPHPGR